MKIFRGQPDHEHWRRPATPTEKAGAWAGLALCFVLLGVLDWVTPPAPPFSGKWSWLYGSLHEAFGPRGVPLAMFAVGALFFIAAILTWWKIKRGNASGA